MFYFRRLQIIIFLFCTIVLTGCENSSSSLSIPNEYVLDNYTDKEYSEVEKELKQNGITNIQTIGTGGYENNDRNNMYIIDQSIPAGQTISSDESVTFTIVKASSVIGEKIYNLPLDQAIEIVHSMGYEDKNIEYKYSGYDTKYITETIERETNKNAWIATGAEEAFISDGIVILCKHADTLLNDENEIQEGE